jgi:hypothetical protein
MNGYQQQRTNYRSAMAPSADAPPFKPFDYQQNIGYEQERKKCILECQIIDQKQKDRQRS